MNMNTPGNTCLDSFDNSLYRRLLSAPVGKSEFYLSSQYGTLKEEPELTKCVSSFRSQDSTIDPSVSCNSSDNEKQVTRSLSDQLQLAQPDSLLPLVMLTSYNEQELRSGPSIILDIYNKSGTASKRNSVELQGKMDTPFSDFSNNTSISPLLVTNDQSLHNHDIPVPATRLNENVTENKVRSNLTEQLSDDARFSLTNACLEDLNVLGLYSQKKTDTQQLPNFELSQPQFFNAIDNHKSGTPRGTLMQQLRKSLALLSNDHLLTLAAFGMVLSDTVYNAGQTLLNLNPLFRRIMIRGLKYSTTDNEFCKYFSQFGELENCAIIRQPDGRSQGYGFLIYKEKASADLVLSQQHFIDKRPVSVKLAADQHAETLKNKKNDKIEDKRKLFIRNICPEITKEAIVKEFSVYGPIEERAIIRPKDDIGKGYGFVTFKNASDASNAVEAPFRLIDGWVIFATFSTGEGKKSRNFLHERESTSNGKHIEPNKDPGHHFKNKEYSQHVQQLSLSQLQGHSKKTTFKGIRPPNNTNFRSPEEASENKHNTKGVGKRFNSKKNGVLDKESRLCENETLDTKPDLIQIVPIPSGNSITLNAETETRNPLKTEAYSKFHSFNSVQEMEQLHEFFPQSSLNFDNDHNPRSNSLLTLPQFHSINKPELQWKLTGENPLSLKQSSSLSSQNSNTVMEDVSCLTPNHSNSSNTLFNVFDQALLRENSSDSDSYDRRFSLPNLPNSLLHSFNTAEASKLVSRLQSTTQTQKSPQLALDELTDLTCNNNSTLNQGNLNNDPLVMSSFDFNSLLL